MPLLLSGNCSGTIGMLAALSAATSRRVGLVWLDAHGDFNTPDTDPYGFLDGQGLAMVVGRCWRTLTATVPGFTPLPERAVVLAGARDVDDQEAPALRDSGITWLDPSQVRDMPTVQEAVQRLADVADVVHVHVDLDVHDPTIAPANGFAAPNGLTANEAHEVIRRSPSPCPSPPARSPPTTPPTTPPGGCATSPWTSSPSSPSLTTTTART